MKDIRDVSLIKRVSFIIFTILIVACGVFVVGKFDFSESVDWLHLEVLPFVTFCLCLLMSLLYLRFNKKSVITTLALIVFCVGAYFYTFQDMTDTNTQYTVLYILCGFQLCFAIYGLFLDKGLGFKVLDIGIRVGLSLLAYFLLPQYLPDYFSTINTIFAIYLINSLFTIVVLCFYFKTNYLTICGLILLLVGVVFYAFIYGAIDLFNITGGFVDFLNSYDIAFLFTALGVYFIATDAVFSSNRVNY